MTTAKKQNSTVKSILGILPAVVLLITMQLITAYAADNNPALTTLDSFPAIYNSTDTMNVNNGTINTLYNGGTVKENNGKISSSRGSVSANPANLTPPQTGDNGNILLRAALLLVSSVALVGTAVFGKRKKRLQIFY